MKSIVFIARKTYSDLLNYRLFLTLAVYTAYDCYLLSFLKGYGLSRGEFVLYSVTDQYVIVYFFALMLSWNILHCFNLNNDFWKLRAIKKRRYYAGTILGIAGNIVTAVAFHILTAFLLSRGFHSKNVFTGASGIDTLFKYPDYFKTPAGAVGGSALYLVLGMTLWFFLMFFIHQRLSVKYMPVFWLGTFFSMVFGAHMGDSAFLRFSLDKWLILYFNLEYMGLMFFLQACIFLILFVLAVWNKKKTKLLPAYINKIYYALRWNLRQLNTGKNRALLAVTILVNIISLAFTDKKATFPDLIATLFSGVSPGSFSLMDFVRMLIINLPPLCLIAAYLQKQVVEADGIIGIRLKNAGMDFICKFTAIVLFLTAYVCSFVAAAYVLCFIQSRNRSSFFYGLELFQPYTNSSLFIFCAAMLRLLELLAAAILIWLCCSLLQSAVAGICLYVCSGLFYFIKGIRFHLSVVFGISGMARFSNVTEQTAASIEKTFVWCILLCGILTCLCCKTAQNQRKGIRK